MARIASNAPLTNQGRADLRRVPTGTQTDFNQTGDSSISVVRAQLLRQDAEGDWVTPEFTVEVPTLPSGTTARRVCVFLWMTDRLTSLSAEQFYGAPVYPESETVVASLGANLCTCAYAQPTNGMAGLPAGLTCSVLSDAEVGAQATLSTTALPAANALSVRGTPILVTMVNNEYYNGGGLAQALEEAQLRIEALSESLLSGKPEANFLTLNAGVFDPYASSFVVSSAQIIMDAAAYLAGTYWLYNNQLLLGGVTFNIVGIYSAPVPPAPPAP
jgi:hypothetical protein